MPTARFPDSKVFSVILVRILSISVSECSDIRVGIVIVGTKVLDAIMVRKSITSLLLSFNILILKSPRITAFFRSLFNLLSIN